MTLTYTRDINLKSDSIVWLYAKSVDGWVTADRYWINDFNRNKKQVWYYVWYTIKDNEHYISLDYVDM